MRSSIADYEVTEVLDRPGGGSTAYRCRPPDRLLTGSGPDARARAGTERPGIEGPGTEVMVTELAVDAAGWSELADRLARSAAIGDSHLLRLLEVGPDLETGGVFVATELPSGVSDRTGDDRSAGGGGRPGTDIPAALARVEAVALAAHALHEAGLAHGDIRPAAVLDTERGPVLGLPRLDAPPGWVVDASSWKDLLAVDPQRMAGEGPSRASDIWALGVMLHGLVSDRPLFPGIEHDEPVTAVQRILFTRPEVDPALPGDVRDLIDACLAADPADRPTTAAAVAEQARAIIDGGIR